MEALTNSWKSLSDDLGDEYKGWFLHSHEEDGYYIDIYRFWIEPFDEHINLTPENLYYGIFHHCLDREALESADGRININDLKTISLYAEDAPSYRLVGKTEQVEERASGRLQVQQEILQLPKYLELLKNVIQGHLEPLQAELESGAVLSSKIL